jgi:hypothetical protein
VRRQHWIVASVTTNLISKHAVSRAVPTSAACKANSILRARKPRLSVAAQTLWFAYESTWQMALGWRMPVPCW